MHLGAGRLILPDFFGLAQFAYRLVTYQNLALLGVVAACLAGLAERRTPVRLSAPVAASLLTWGACCLCLKLIQAGTILTLPANDYIYGSANEGLQTAHFIYNPWDYATPSFFGRSPSDVSHLPIKAVALDVKNGTDFGRVKSMTVNLDRPTLMVTNVFAFPWNQLKLDGHFIPTPSSCSWPKGTLAIELAPGQPPSGI
jgi:hypothetical protein